MAPSQSGPTPSVPVPSSSPASSGPSSWPSEKAAVNQPKPLSIWFSGA